LADYRDDRNRDDGASPLADMVDGAVRRISTAIAIAGALIAIGIYARPGPPSYQAFWTGSSIVRVNTRSGTILECVGRDCGIVVQRGQHLSRRPPEKAAPAATPQPAQSQPAPAALPAPQSAPASPAPKQTVPAQSTPAR
jgi:hypothetical protein